MIKPLDLVSKSRKDKLKPNRDFSFKDNLLLWNFKLGACPANFDSFVTYNLRYKLFPNFKQLMYSLKDISCFSPMFNCDSKHLNSSPEIDIYKQYILNLSFYQFNKTPDKQQLIL